MRASFGGRVSHADLLWPLPAAALGLLAVSGLVPAPLLLAMLAAAVVVIFAARRPDRALLVLIVLLPFQTLLLAKLYGWGVPGSIVRPLAGWKEALAIGVTVAGFIRYKADRKPFDAVDWLALAFVGIAAVYALIPEVFTPNAPMAAEARSLAFRQDAAFVILLLGARHARLPAGFLTRAAQVALAIATIVAATAIYEYFFSSAWNDFIVNTLQFAKYQVQVLHVFPLNALDYRVYGDIAGEHVIRTGSVFLNPGTCGFYLLIGFAFGIENVLRRGARPASVAALATIGAALLLTQTRSALIGALLIAFLAFTFAPGRRGGRQIQFALVLLVGLLLALPAASSTGLSARASTTASSDDPGATSHLDALRNGFDSVIHHPLGQGLGTSAGTGQRFNQVQVVAESSYIQVGNELGLVAMVVFIGLTIAAVRALHRAAAATPNLAVASLWAAAVGLAVAAFFLHAWTDFSVSWTFWGLAGAAIGVSARQRAAAETV